jgi:hypothetical protein
MYMTAAGLGGLTLAGGLLVIDFQLQLKQAALRDPPRLQLLAAATANDVTVLNYAGLVQTRAGQQHIHETATGISQHSGLQSAVRLQELQGKNSGTGDSLIRLNACHVAHMCHCGSPPWVHHMLLLHCISSPPIHHSSTSANHNVTFTCQQVHNPPADNKSSSP